MTVTGAVEARWGESGVWTDLVTTDLTFSGTIENQSPGQKTLWVRMKNDIDRCDFAHYVGVGDNFVVAGQSNASGRAINNQTYSNATLKATMFANDFVWKELADPTDSNIGQIDAVSSETGAAGSIWPIIADSIMANYNIPVGIIPCAMGGTSLWQWLPGVDHTDRATLYGSMKYRAANVGVKAVLWWQGESDAYYCITQAAYNTDFDVIVNAINTDLSVKLMPVLLQNSSGQADTCEAKIRAAISEAWGDNANVLVGPDFSDLTSDDDAHLITNAKIDSAANRFWRKIRDNIY